MVTIATPIIIAIKEDISESLIDLRIILAPISISWVALIIVLILFLSTVNNYYKMIKMISKKEQYK